MDVVVHESFGPQHAALRGVLGGKSVEVYVICSWCRKGIGLSHKTLASKRRERTVS